MEKKSSLISKWKHLISWRFFEKKIFLFFLALVLAFMLSQTQLVSVCRANPWFYVKEGEVDVPIGTPPLDITFVSPKNLTYHNNSILLIAQIVSPAPLGARGSINALYMASWLGNKTEDFSYPHNVTLRDVPEGPQYIEVSVCCEISNNFTPVDVGVMHYTTYKINGSSIIHFTVDSPPNVTITSITNGTTYNTPITSLNFTVNEPFTNATYCIDQKTNETINGNIALADQTNGHHTISLYVWDIGGNVGATTVDFNVQTFPTFTVAATIAVLVTGLSLGLVVYFKKQKSNSHSAVLR